MFYWIVSVISSFIFGALVLVQIGEEEIERGFEAVSLIEECQKDLRRDEYCTIIAVPTDEVEED